MNNIGISSSWKKAFRRGFEEQYISLVIDSYQAISSMERGTKPWEDTRRNMLCAQMQKAKSQYGITFNIDSERGVWDGDFKDKGRIDICCYLNQLDDQYIAFECKRFLRKDLVPGYIKNEYYQEGIKRFEENVYSPNVNIGGMIAFLEEGDYIKLKNKMVEELPKYTHNNSVGDISNKYKHNYVLKTVHLRNENRNIKLIHILMNFS